ncbi:MAG: hypothetical protein WA989_04735 [Henriciella sp.]|uniref:dCTP deaminase domain-containing protein n=1 Tax=Henriciella sp. TaxID=1968823 RepID=UPI003C759AD3
MFWSADTLRKRLPELIHEYDAANVQRANYTLSIGPEISVSPSRQPEGPTDQTKIQLQPDQAFRIPAGQFAFLLTEETIEIPPSAIAFISIRARFKFRGLVNVSGFHVDPGFKGRLVFAVFNAGPSAITLARGEKCFHIWYADLDHPHEDVPRPGYSGIDTSIINDLGPQLNSFESLAARIEDSEKRYHARADTIERMQDQIKTIATILITLFIAIFAALLALLLPRWLARETDVTKQAGPAQVTTITYDVDRPDTEPVVAPPADEPQ